MATVDVDDVRATLRACVRFFRENAEQSGYGYFCGGDPRLFTPDPECSTDEEREAHRLACEAWERGERTEGPRREIVPAEEARAKLAAGGYDAATIGPEFASLQPSGYGLGTYVMIDDDMRDLAEQCEATLARLGG